MKANFLVGPSLRLAFAGCSGQPKEPSGAGAAQPSADASVLGPDDVDPPVPLAGGLSPTPPMGWNSWNAFGCNVTDKLVEAAADAIVANGMKDAGYQYVNIDDCRAQTARADDGTPLAASNFPDGIQAVADYVHAKGLKLGIYSDRGTQTCAGRIGSQDHEAQDAMNYAAWDSSPISLRGTVYSKGLGVDGPSLVIYRLAQKCSAFTAVVGVDDVTKGQGSVVFQVWGDDQKLFDSGLMTGKSAPQTVNVALDGSATSSTPVRRLKLLVTNGGDGAGLDRADWANAQVTCAP